MKLTHLCFVDDLLIFSEASLNSVYVIKQAMQDFKDIFGLKVNPLKSFIFCARKLQLLDTLHMQEGHLPIRYLGVPLISSTLSSTDCQVLL